METVGARLREARVMRGMSIEDIAQVTKIPRASVAALEAWELHRLPPLVFVRGFIRAYAAAVGLDGNELVRDLRDTPAAVEPATTTRVLRERQEPEAVPAWLSLDEATRPGPAFRPGQAALLVVALGMVLAAWFMVGQRKGGEPETAQPGVPTIGEPVDGVSTFTDASR